jgi:hypothetical protein
MRGRKGVFRLVACRHSCECSTGHRKSDALFVRRLKIDRLVERRLESVEERSCQELNIS